MTLSPKIKANEAVCLTPDFSLIILTFMLHDCVIKYLKIHPNIRQLNDPKFWTFLQNLKRNKNLLHPRGICLDLLFWYDPTVLKKSTVIEQKSDSFNLFSLIVKL